MNSRACYANNMLYLVRSDGTGLEIPFDQLESWEQELTELLAIVREAIVEMKRQPGRPQ
jgi:hypothetical protein